MRGPAGRSGAVLALALAAATPLAGAGEIVTRVIFRNDLPPVRVQDPDAGIYYVRVGLFGDGPVDAKSNLPDFSTLPLLKEITFGRPIEGKHLPGRVYDISKKDLEERKASDPDTLIRENTKKTLFEGALPAAPAWLRVRYDITIYTRKMKDTVQMPGARNWLAIALPVAPEDRSFKIDPAPDPCATLVLTLTALVKGVGDDENDFTAGVESRCE